MRPSEQDILCRKQSTILDSISDGVIAADLDGKISYVNKAAERITGFRAEDAIGKPCNEIFRPNAGGEDCPLQRTLGGREPVINHLIRMTDRKGRQVPISVSTALLKDLRGRVIGGVETFRDLDLVQRLRRDFEAKYTYGTIVSRNSEMQELFKILPMIAASESTVLIEGESGTGKELVARALYSLSPREKGPFISINCGALPDTLLESELFGYVAGAFTDAKKDKKGRFALADKGTLLLDEIGDISPAMQVKLLRVLQERTFEPLGSTQSVKTNVRLIAVTNQPLGELVDQGHFRRDLFYRINVMKLTVPPLRERKEDIPLLIDHFIAQFNQLRQKDVAGVDPPALNLLLNHYYPGNIRELENIIEHAFVLSPGGVIKPEHLPDYLREKAHVLSVELAGSLKGMEALFIMAALKRNGWSRKETAQELGVNPSTLYRKIKKLGLKVPTDSQ